MMLLSGRLDTATAPLLERKIRQWGGDVTELILDLAGLSYISSMGLRVLLQTQKNMIDKEQKLIIKNIGPQIREVFELTGFVKLLVQEEKFVVIRKEEPDCIRLSLIGQMDAANVPDLARELSQIRDTNQAREETTFIILDAEKLTSLSTAGGRMLKRAAAETAWDKRKLTLHNMSPGVRAVIEAEGLGGVFETG